MLQDAHWMNVIERFRLDPDGDTYGTLRPSDIVDLARGGVFPKNDPKNIEDKNKADILAKCLVCLQVIWMLIEVNQNFNIYPLWFS
jgi:hypothetical protein